MWLYLSGLSLSAAYLFSYEVAFLVTWAFIIFIIIKSGIEENRFVLASLRKNLKRLLRELLIFITGLLALAVPVYLYFMAKAGFRDMFYWLVWVPLVAYAKYLSIPLSLYFTNLSMDRLIEGFPLYRPIEGFPLYMEIIVYISWIVYLIYRLGIKKHFLPRNLNLLLILLFGLFLFKIATVRSDHSHFMFAVTPAFILFLFSMTKLFCFLRRKDASRAFRTLVNMLFAMIILCMAVYGEYEWDMYLNSPSDYSWLGAERGQILVNKRWADDLNAVVRYAREKTKHSDYIFVIPAEPYIYFLSGRRNPTPNGSYHKGEVIWAKQVEVIKNLEGKKPRLVIFGGNFREDFVEYYKGMLTYIYNSYQLTERIGKYEVYTPKAY